MLPLLTRTAGFASRRTLLRSQPLSTKVISVKPVRPHQRRQPVIKTPPKPVLDLSPKPKLSRKRYLDILDQVKPTSSLDLVVRLDDGKYACDKVREEGYVPGVIHGFRTSHGEKDILVAIKANVIHQQLRIRQGSFENTMYELRLNDGRRYAAVVAKYMPHQVNELPWTLNFKIYNPDKGAKIFMPFFFLDQELSPAVKRGGFVNRYNWGMLCKVRGETVPNSLHFSAAGMEVGDRIRFNDMLNNKEGLVTVGKLDRKKETNPIVATIKGKELEVEEVDELEELLKQDLGF